MAAGLGLLRLLSFFVGYFTQVHSVALLPRAEDVVCLRRVLGCGRARVAFFRKSSAVAYIGIEPPFPEASGPKMELRVGSYEITVIRKIAEGGFGLVYLVQEGSSAGGQLLCLKKCAINRQESYNTVKKEVAMLKRFGGAHVVQLLASEVNIRSGSDALLLLELCPNGHLLERLQARNGELLPESVAHRIFGQILMGVRPMHESKPPVVHRDLKLENILFAKDNNVRICDFGSAYEGYMMLRDAGERAEAEENISKETTQMYRAPEMIDLFMRPRPTEKTDIWALGCIFYALCFLTHPFQDAGSLGILGAKVNMPATAAVSAESRTLITRMLDVSAAFSVLCPVSSALCPLSSALCPVSVLSGLVWILVSSRHSPSPSSPFFPPPSPPV